MAARWRDTEEALPNLCINMAVPVSFFHLDRAFGNLFKPACAPADFSAAGAGGPSRAAAAGSTAGGGESNVGAAKAEAEGVC